MPRAKKYQQSGSGGFTNLPSTSAAGDGRNLPSFGDIKGLGSLLDLLMRDGVYVAFQRGSDGGVIGITVLDGADKRRAWCHSDDELIDALATLADERADKEVAQFIRHS